MIAVTLDSAKCVRHTRRSALTCGSARERIHKRTPDKFLLKCGEAVRTHGGGLPALFNDEVIIPSQFLNVPGITKEDAYDYSVIGCSEVSIGGRGTEGFAYQGMNGGRLLETLMAGTDPTTGDPLSS